jgi:hypothetical protein
MTKEDTLFIAVGEPNWVPLERVLTPRECETYMYMGCAGEIELYKHRWTRRYLNIDRDGRFYFYSDGSYVEVTQAAAIQHVRR